ncbi:hypothetical protein, partial [Metaclostridioides mangenotii]|uniref:hypothetical protein n=1 Tax=Metaclostridioides mangenotii TaxID=1540 RepID=UPI000466DA82
EGKENENEMLTFKYDILVKEDKENPENNEIVTVDFFNSTLDMEGDVRPHVKKAIKRYKTYETRAENKVGTIITCICKMGSNEYYSNGKLHNSVRLKLSWDGVSKQKNIGANWKSHVYIKDIIETEDKVIVKGLVNDYMTQKSILGYNVDLFIIDEELQKAFLDTFNIGDIIPMEGNVNQEVVEVDISSMDLDSLEVKGIGSARDAIIKENEKRKYIRENGLNRVVKYYNITGGYEALDSTDGTPFTKYKIKEMIDKLNKDLEKSKLSDIEKMEWLQIKKMKNYHFNN